MKKLQLYLPEQITKKKDRKKIVKKNCKEKKNCDKINPIFCSIF